MQQGNEDLSLDDGSHVKTFVLNVKMLNPKFHWLCQIATTLCKFHWQFWIFFLDASAKAKKTNSQIYSTESKASFTDIEFLALAIEFNIQTLT